jgi:hypothetical protein
MAGDDGLCAIHGGRQDPRELGRKGGRVGRGNAAIRKLPAAMRRGLREKLRDELDHEAVKVAIQAILAGNSQAAQVQAIRFLADLELYKDKIAEAARQFDIRFNARAKRSRDIRREQLRQLLEPLGLTELLDVEEEPIGNVQFVWGMGAPGRG